MEPGNKVAILDPWKATAFTAMTGIKVHTKIHLHAMKIDREAYAFLDNFSQDTDFLIENGITMVYHQGEVSNPDLSRIRKGVYLLDID